MVRCNRAQSSSESEYADFASWALFLALAAAGLSRRGIGWLSSAACRQLRLKGKDGKYYLTDCTDKAEMRTILSHLPNKTAAPLLRRNGYNIETIEKALAGESEHKCGNLMR